MADAHYNRQHVGAPGFVPPGRCVVLLTEKADALWVTSWPFAEYVKHAWPGAWICSLFRNEGAGLASELIREAVACTLGVWPEPPSLGMVTFIDPEKVRPTMVRGQAVLGWTWRKAGFDLVGVTAGGLYALQLRPGKMPKPQTPRGHYAQTLMGI